MGAGIEQRFGAPDISLHRAELHAALISINAPDIVHFDKKLVGLDRAGSRLRLTFADGTRTEADAVIGADGVHSTVLDIPVRQPASLASPDRWPIARPIAALCFPPKSTIGSNGGVPTAIS